jgi:hypothetical protein
MRAKYLRLGALEGMGRGPELRAALRATARAWPGSLREAELVHPAEIARRLACTEAWARGEVLRAAQRPGGPGGPGGAGGGSGLAVLAWLDVHLLLAAQHAARAAGRAGEHGPMGSRAAYAQVAHRVGIGVPELHRVLLGR